MSEELTQIKNKIKEKTEIIEQKRKKQLYDIFNNIKVEIQQFYKHPRYDTTIYQNKEDFNKFIKKKKILSRKEYNLFKKIRYYIFLYSEYTHNRFPDILDELYIYFHNNKEPWFYNNSLWNLLIRFGNIIIKYQEDYINEVIVPKYKKRLEEIGNE